MSPSPIVVLWLLAASVCLATAKTTSYSQSKGSSEMLTLDSFSKKLIWEQPEEGLYMVDAGLKPAEGETGTWLLAFADLNNDKYTDIITTSISRNTYSVHLFDKIKNMFAFQKTMHPANCDKITNLVVGRSSNALRIFLTCNKGSQTFVQLYDKAAKTMDFTHFGKDLEIEAGTEPFVADLNGDMLEDVLYNDPKTK